MDKYHVWTNRFLCCLCSSLYFISVLVFADEKICKGPGTGEKPFPSPNCTFFNQGSNVFKVGRILTNSAGDISYYCLSVSGSYGAGYEAFGGGCVTQKNNCQAGQEPPGSTEGSAGKFWTSPGRAAGRTTCMENGCIATGDPNGSTGVGGGAGGGVDYFTFFKNMRQTGATCNYDDQKKNGNNPDKKCAPNEGTAVVNGVTTCHPRGEKPQDNPRPKTETTTKETQSPDGTKTKTETTTTTQQNGDGTGTTTTTTTTTKTDGAGNVISKETSTETKKTDKGNLEDEDSEKKNNEFCKANPNLNICKNSTVEGACENTTCNGDAITCEILKLERANDCEVKKDTPEKTLGKQINSKNDPLQSSLPSLDNAKQVDLTQLNLNANGWGFGGACMQDKQISVMGKFITIPLSSLCEYLLALRYGIMLIASILSFKILSGAVLTV